jgi:outer membrane protein assembly factor BamB
MLERVALGAVALPFVLGTAAASPPADGRVVFRFQDPAIVEASGLVVQDGLFLTTNDSGDTGRVFAVDPDTGRTSGVTTWASEPEDVEALAPAGTGEVWVGDIGDNLEDRSSIRVTRVPVGAGDRDAAGSSYDLVLPGPPTDAESLLSQPGSGRLFVATKSIFGSALFAAPKELSPDRPNRMQRVGRTLTFATDGAFFPDGRHLVIRNYAQAVVYTFPGLERVAALALPDQQQGEAIAVSADDRVYVTSEGRGQAVMEVNLPASVRERLSPTPEEPAAATSSTTPRPRNELPEEAARPSRDPWQWLLGGGLFVVAVVVLLFAVRPDVRQRSELPRR